jgi:hypothetical protein
MCKHGDEVEIKQPLQDDRSTPQIEQKVMTSSAVEKTFDLMGLKSQHHLAFNAHTTHQ